MSFRFACHSTKRTIYVKDLALKKNTRMQFAASISHFISNFRGPVFCAIVAISKVLPVSSQESVRAPTVGVTPQVGAAQQPRFQERSSDVISYWYGSDYRTPFVVDPNTGKAASIARNSIEYTHVGTWGILSNFADVMVNISNLAEPATVAVRERLRPISSCVRESTSTNSRIRECSTKGRCATLYLSSGQTWKPKTPRMRPRRKQST